MPLTLEDIARIASCSRSTVSRVINGDVNVSAATRQSVNKVIQELNFQPNLAARSLASGQTHVLGLIIPLGVASIFSDPFYPLLIQSISTTCNQRDYSIMLWLAAPEFERRTIHQVLYTGLIDGVIVSAMSLIDPVIQSLAESNLHSSQLDAILIMTRHVMLTWKTIMAPGWLWITCIKWDAVGLVRLLAPAM